MRWCVEVDLRQLCINSHKQLMEMKVGWTFVSAFELIHHGVAAPIPVLAMLE